MAPEQMTAVTGHWQEKTDKHRYCLLCGQENPLSMRLNFVANADGNSVSAKFRSHPHLQGYTGIMHGGVICALLDSAMTNYLFFRGIEAVTGELAVKFHHSIPCTAEICVRACMDKASDPLFVVCASIHHQNQLMASATAKFMKKC